MQHTHTLDYRDASSPAWLLPNNTTDRRPRSFLGDFLQWRKVSSLYEDIRRGHQGRSFADRALTQLQVRYDIVQGGLEDIPREGPLLVVANHPFGAVEGLVLLKLLTTVRQDVKLMANAILSGIPELQRHMIPVDPFGGSGAAAKNVAPLRQSLRWLRKGGVLAMFPAGEVAHLSLARRRICESDWHATVARLLRRSGASVLPVFFEGVNGPLFQVAGLFHPRLRTAMLAREMVNKTGRSLKVRIGRALPLEKLDVIRDDGELARYLRMRVQLLGAGPRVARQQVAGRAWSVRRAPLALKVATTELACEVARLPAEQQLAEAGDYRVYVAGSQQIPEVVREIARLRELTFRGVGEGTGRAMDMDVYDGFYQHLFVWNEATSDVVGAYRLGLTDSILRQYGLCGLYTTTLFSYGWDLIRTLNPAIEIGRSFVRQEYQRKHLPLLLLWRGIGAYVARNPKYRYLFGTVSMSNNYCDVSRQLVAQYFEQDKSRRPSWQTVHPRNPLRWKGHGVGDATDFACRIPDLDTLSEMVSEIEPDGKGIPVLMRQYMKLGGQVLACNVDPKFNMALDAFLLVDLPRTNPRLLELYMGPMTSAYRRRHNVV